MGMTQNLIVPILIRVLVAMIKSTYNKASQNRQQASWTRKLAFAGRRYALKGSR